MARRPTSIAAAATATPATVHSLPRLAADVGQHVHLLADDELLRRVENTDPLVATALERELASRLAERIAEIASAKALLDVVGEFGIEKPGALRARLVVADDADAAAAKQPTEARALLSVLGEFGFENPTALRKTLRRDELLTELLDTAQRDNALPDFLNNAKEA